MTQVVQDTLVQRRKSSILVHAAANVEQRRAASRGMVAGKRPKTLEGKDEGEEAEEPKHEDSVGPSLTIPPPPVPKEEEPVELTEEEKAIQKQQKEEQEYQKLAEK